MVGMNLDPANYPPEDVCPCGQWVGRGRPDMTRCPCGEIYWAIDVDEPPLPPQPPLPNGMTIFEMIGRKSPYLLRRLVVDSGRYMAMLGDAGARKVEPPTPRRRRRRRR
jgi:hypothetical protein